MMLWSEKLLGGKRLVDWTFPVLKDNGTMGGDNYAVVQSGNYQANLAYRITNPNNTTPFGSFQNPPSYFLFYTPKPVYITDIYFPGIWSWSSRSDCTVTIIIQGSNNNTSWDNLHTMTVKAYDTSAVINKKTVTINSENAYKYIRIYCSASNKNVDPVYIYITISGKMEA